MNYGLRVAAILAIATVAGALQLTLSGHPWVPDLEKVKKTQESKSELEKRHAALRASAGVTLEEFHRIIASDGAIVFDARPASEFEKGHLAIDGAIPVLNVEPDPENFQRSLDRILPLQGQPILIYCTSNTCELGEELYLELEKVGFFGMKIYFPGWEGLVAAGVKSATGPDTWTIADANAAMGQPAGDPGDAQPEPEQPAEQP